MDIIATALGRLQTEEGFRALPYTDTTGHETIGYGFNVSAGISRTAAQALLQAQIGELAGQLESLPWWTSIPDNCKVACLDIAFNAGLHGLLGFPHMIAAMTAGDMAGAAAQCQVADPQLNASRYAGLRQLILGA